jgi:predicted Zn-dependent peptidase
MRKGWIVVLAALLLAPQAAWAARAGSVEEAKEMAPPLELEKKDPETFTLSNGIRVWYLRNERLPLVNVRAVVRTGAVWEPEEEQGVAELTGRMLRVGGTASRTPAEVDDELDFLAANLSASIGNDQGNVSLNVLSGNLEPALEILADVLENPAFDPSRLDVQKNLQKEEIRRQNDSPVQVAFREYAQLVWGRNHPRARTPTEESVDALSRENLVAFHAKYFTPGNVILGVTGDLDRKKVKRLLDAALGGWTGDAPVFPEVPPSPEARPQAALAPKDVPQTTVVIGHLGPREDDPHRASGEVMMHILGSGGFTSYITDRVRNDEGLAYFAAGFLQFGRMDSGNVITAAMSKAESACQAADLIRDQIVRIRTEPVTEEDLNRAKDAILNSQAFEWDSPAEVVTRFMNNVYYELPEGHDERVLEEVGTVTAADVQEAAQAILHPDRLTFLAVGNPDAMDCDWSRFAEDLGVELERIELE